MNVFNKTSKYPQKSNIKQQQQKKFKYFLLNGCKKYIDDNNDDYDT